MDDDGEKVLAKSSSNLLAIRQRCSQLLNVHREYAQFFFLLAWTEKKSNIKTVIDKQLELEGGLAQISLHHIANNVPSSLLSIAQYIQRPTYIEFGLISVCAMFVCKKYS